MQYFIEEIGCIKENDTYAEFRVFDPRNNTSVYMLRSVTDKTKFCDFWQECMQEDIVFDMNSVSKSELEKMAKKAEKCGGIIFDAVFEFKTWADLHLTDDKKIILVDWDNEYSEL